MSVRGVPDVGRTMVMGVLNVTPDSFSDGGAWADAAAAIQHGLDLAASGADIVDVGGESTRPGASRVPLEEELRRVLSVVSALAAAGVVVSIDTTRRPVAEAALEAGARIVNDVSGGLADPDLPRLVAERDVPYILMHWRGHSNRMQELASYDDVVGEVCGELRTALEAAVAAGVDPEQIVLDPGLGFAKDAEHNWTLLAHFDQLSALGRPVLVGASRKSFLGVLLDGRPVDQRDDATSAITAIVAAQGGWGVRVHDAAASADAVRVASAIRAAR